MDFGKVAWDIFEKTFGSRILPIRSKHEILGHVKNLDQMTAITNGHGTFRGKRLV